MMVPLSLLPPQAASVSTIAASRPRPNSRFMITPPQESGEIPVSAFISAGEEQADSSRRSGARLSHQSDAFTRGNDHPTSLLNRDGEQYRLAHRQFRPDRYECFTLGRDIEYTAIDGEALITLGVEDPQLVLPGGGVIRLQAAEAHHAGLFGRVPDHPTTGVCGGRI